jgi:hypothetical protein
MTIIGQQCCMQVGCKRQGRAICKRNPFLGSLQSTHSPPEGGVHVISFANSEREEIVECIVRGCFPACTREVIVDLTDSRHAQRGCIPDGALDSSRIRHPLHLAGRRSWRKHPRPRSFAVFELRFRKSSTEVGTNAYFPRIFVNSFSRLAEGVTLLPGASIRSNSARTPASIAATLSAQCLVRLTLDALPGSEVHARAQYFAHAAGGCLDHLMDRALRARCQPVLPRSLPVLYRCKAQLRATAVKGYPVSKARERLRHADGFRPRSQRAPWMDVPPQ